VKKKVWFTPPVHVLCWIGVRSASNAPATSKHLPLFTLTTCIGNVVIGNFGASNVSADCLTVVVPSPPGSAAEGAADRHAN
jgi:hypothetical protein